MRAVTTTVLLLAGALTVAAPAVAQIGGGAGPRYPYQSNPIDRAYQDVQKPLPRLPCPAAGQPLGA
jgi:hypothetical protein